ncbi:hypothetical protein Trydic_g8106 [Trypoxylus dichotomus]
MPRLMSLSVNKEQVYAVFALLEANRGCTICELYSETRLAHTIALHFERAPENAESCNAMNFTRWQITNSVTTYDIPKFVRIYSACEEGNGVSNVQLS